MKRLGVLILAALLPGCCPRSGERLPAGPTGGVERAAPPSESAMRFDIRAESPSSTTFTIEARLPPAESAAKE